MKHHAKPGSEVGFTKSVRIPLEMRGLLVRSEVVLIAAPEVEHIGQRVADNAWNYVGRLYEGVNTLEQHIADGAPEDTSLYDLMHVAAHGMLTEVARDKADQSTRLIFANTGINTFYRCLQQARADLSQEAELRQQ